MFQAGINDIGAYWSMVLFIDWVGFRGPKPNKNIVEMKPA